MRRVFCEKTFHQLQTEGRRRLDQFRIVVARESIAADGDCIGCFVHRIPANRTTAARTAGRKQEAENRLLTNPSRVASPPIDAKKQFQNNFAREYFLCSVATQCDLN